MVAVTLSLANVGVGFAKRETGNARFSSVYTAT